MTDEPLPGAVVLETASTRHPLDKVPDRILNVMPVEQMPGHTLDRLLRMLAYRTSVKTQSSLANSEPT